MKYLQSFDKFYLLLVYPILRLTLPYLQYRLRSWTMVPFVIAWFVHVMQDRRYMVRDHSMDRYFSQTLIWFAVYMLLPLFFWMLGGNTELYQFRIFGEGTNIIVFVFMFSIVHYSLKWGKIRELKFLTLLLLFSFGWMAIAALRGGEKVLELGGARMVTAINQANSEALTVQYMQDASEAALSGMGTAASTYVSAFAIPLFLYSFFFIKPKIGKGLCLVMAYANFLNIKYSGINTPYMIAGVGVVLACGGLLKRWRKALVAMGIIAAICVLVFAYYPTMLSFAAEPLMELSYATERFGQFSSRCASVSAALAGDTDTYAFQRYQLQVSSFNTFLDGNWLFGTVCNPKALIGGHSQLLDGLAKFGILSLVFLVLFWYSYLRYCDRLMKVCYRPRWSVMPYIFAGAWIFSSVPNPAALGTPAIVLLIAGLGLFYREFDQRWGMA